MARLVHRDFQHCLFLVDYFVTFLQLRCGCSYAFAAMGALEGATALAHGNLVKLSEQNVVDCSGNCKVPQHLK